MGKDKETDDNQMPVRDVVGLLTNSVIQSRMNLQNSATGESDLRDLDSELGYPDKIEIADYKKQFKRGGIGTRVVKIKPDETWSVIPSINENQKVDRTDFEQTWDNFNTRFRSESVV